MDVMACPRCRDAMRDFGSSWACSGCGAAYPTIRGIPDLRTADDVFLSNADDWAYARKLDEDFDRLDFRGLLDRYFDLSPEIPPDLRQRQIHHILSAPARARQWVESLALNPNDNAPLLDLGCGPGGFLAASAHSLENRPLWGVDIALRWLILARKRLDEEGFGHVRLVCGCSERLPFRTNTFAGVVAGDVIEHVNNQAETLSETHRVLKPGAHIVLATPNRFSLAPEPHVGVWGVGFLPRPLMAPYVRLARGLDFKAIRTHGAGGWTRLLRHGPFQGGSVEAPPLPREVLATSRWLTQRLGHLYNAIVALPPGRILARSFGPMFQIVARKPAPESTPTTRPRSRPATARA